MSTLTFVCNATGLTSAVSTAMLTIIASKTKIMAIRYLHSHLHDGSLERPTAGSQLASEHTGQLVVVAEKLLSRVWEPILLCFPLFLLSKMWFLFSPIGRLGGNPAFIE